MSDPTSPVISIGCQAGGPDATIVSELKVPLYRSLAKHVTSTHCSAIDEYALVLRVDGSLDKFGEEGLARLRFVRTRRYVAVDIQIPEAVWLPMTKPQLAAYLARQVKVAVIACASRLRKDNFAVADQELLAQIDSATIEYLAVQNDG